nr:MAG TPA: hypothetical protein [Caudoviricetes sp.]
MVFLPFCDNTGERIPLPRFMKILKEKNIRPFL